MMRSNTDNYPISCFKRPYSATPRPLRNHRLGHAGFTLIEIMISLALAGMVLGGVYVAYRGQVRTYNTQQQVVDMQQNARLGMFFMERELRMAGLDPTGGAAAAVTVANIASVSFSMDFTGGENDGIDNDNDGNTDETDGTEWFDGDATDAGEQVSYALSNDANGDGVCDGLANDTPCNLTRDISGDPANPDPQLLALNIDALRFDYFGLDPGNAGCTDDNCRLGTPVANPDNIRRVMVTLIARSGASVPVYSEEYRNSILYRTPDGDVLLATQNDEFRRFPLNALVNLRNLGL